jgi:NAD(P)-dependent dehydrogenase (short-subunit alcohol dehydrogenase family)
MVFKKFDLSGKVAVVTGDNLDRTRVFVKALAENGADVVAVARDVTDISGVMEELQGMGRKGAAINTDITNSEDVTNVVEMILARFGKIDILVNDAAHELVKPFVNSAESEWQIVIDNNLKAVMLWCQVVGKHMLGCKGSRIINIISGLSVRGLPNHAVYCATMGGVHQFTKALALEWAKQNVRVNAIAHGWLSSEEGNESITEDSLTRYIPLRRLGKPSDLVGFLVYLASDASDYVIGETIFVDGGLTSHG